jgi:hypothetical protein
MVKPHCAKRLKETVRERRISVNPMKGQTATYNDSQKQKLAVNPVKGLTILCQVSPMNWATDHNKIGKQKRLESGGRQRRTAAAGDRQQMVVFAGGSECLVLELGWEWSLIGNWATNRPKPMDHWIWSEPKLSEPSLTRWAGLTNVDQLEMSGGTGSNSWVRVDKCGPVGLVIWNEKTCV